MKTQLTIPAPRNRWLPLILIAVLTIAIFIVSIISLLSGWQTIFQNLFYFPIILACVFYVKRGFVFSVILASSYFVLMAIFSMDPVVLEGAFVRVLIFILVAGVITYLSMIRIRAEEALKESEEFNRGLVENMPNLVLVYDHDRKIRYVNPAATTILGYSAEEMLGTDIITYVVPRQHAEIAAAIEERFTSGRGESLEVEFITKAGQYLTVISKGAPLHFQDQPAVLILLADISDRKRAEEALRLANKKLNLLSSVTRHDINNQLTVQMGYLTILEKKQPDPALNEYFRKVTTAAKRIAAMVQFTKEYEEIGIHAPAWQDCRKLVETASKEAPLGMVVVKNDLPSGAEVFADPLVVKVFYNLMDNAARYGGKITTIRLSVDELDGDHVVVCEDDGDGIVAVEKEKIFERNFGKNTGLGLALSREILSITGIAIKETGEPGKGARFEMVVPKGAWRMA
ncbi:MAG: PAS domain S-box protein [Methanomicrobiales archaeon]